MFSHGRHRRDFTYIDDIVEGVIRVLDRPATFDPNWRGDSPDPAASTAPYRLYNIGNNQSVELDRYIAALESCLGRTAKKNRLPPQPGDVPDTLADVDELARDFRVPAVHACRGGHSARFVDWYRAYYRTCQ